MEKETSDSFRVGVANRKRAELVFLAEPQGGVLCQEGVCLPERVAALRHILGILGNSASVEAAEISNRVGDGGERLERDCCWACDEGGGVRSCESVGSSGPGLKSVWAMIKDH